MNAYFAAQTRAKVSQFKTMLQNILKGSLSMTEHLSKVKNTMDRLALVGHVATDSDYVKAMILL